MVGFFACTGETEKRRNRTRELGREIFDVCWVVSFCIEKGIYC